MSSHKHATKYSSHTLGIGKKHAYA